MTTHHVFFDSLQQWEMQARKDEPVYCLPVKEDYPDPEHDGKRVIYGILQLSQAQGAFVHHIRFLVTKHPSSDAALREQKATLLDGAYQNMLKWLQDKGFLLVRQGLLTYHRELRTLQTALPKEFVSE